MQEQQLCSSTQAGNRPDLSTLHQRSALQHVIDKQKHAKQPLYLCFVALKSTYDKVQRPLLWRSLWRLGIHGGMLAAIQSMYDGCLLSMRVGGLLLSSGRAAHSVLPSLTSSLMACIITFSLHAQMLASKSIPSALQTCCMLMTSASWQPARLSCKPSSMLRHHSVKLYTCKSVLQKRRQWPSPLGSCRQAPSHAMGS